MAESTATRFRRRASECRQMAAEVQESDRQELLLSLAEDLEREAEEIGDETEPD